MTQKDKNRLFNPGKADWVQKKGSRNLDKDQQALLLALAQLESEMGRELDDEERAAIQSLAEHLEGFDPKEIKTAVHRMVRQPADPNRKVTWPELKDHIS